MSTKRVVIVDWLGRGGIAHTSHEWSETLRAAGHTVAIVTRPGRDLEGIPVSVASGSVRAHRNVADAAVDAIKAERPDLVVVQNYVLPLLERRVFAAAARVGAPVALVMHNARAHSPLSGTRSGLARLLRRADRVIAHSAFVADEVSSWVHRSVDVVPLPIPRMLVGGSGALAPSTQLTAVHFGVLKRGYKGTDLVLDIVAAAPPGWRFQLVGNGAASSTPGVEVVSGYVPNEALAAIVRDAAVTLLPYRRASQSAAVVLAQALGSVVVTTNVGGLPEQVTDGETGVVLRPDASVSEWVAALAKVADSGVRAMIAARALVAVEQRHARFVSYAEDVVASV